MVVFVRSNVAEDFERGMTPELLTFLYIVWGSPPSRGRPNLVPRGDTDTLIYP